VEQLVPITIVPPNNQVSMPIGPGSVLVANTNFIGPLPDGTHWNIQLTSDSEGAHILAFSSFFSTAHQVFPQIGVNSPGWSWSWPGLAGIGEGGTAFVQAELQEPNGTVIDSGTAQFPWSIGAAGQAGLPAATGGFTDEDRATLQLTNAWAALDTFITSLILEDLGTAPPGGQLAAQLPEWRYGIIVRLLQIPADLIPTGPDQDYWVKTLASVRIFRGTDILHRIPIHRSSQIIPFEGNGMILQFPAVSLDLWAPGLTVEVDFLPGVAGQAFLMKLP
jgi:hypothetical protein